MIHSSVNDSITISVVIPSHDRASSVLRLLTCLNTQRGHAEDNASSDFEVIVIADGCSDGTSALLQESIDAARWSFPLTIIEHETARGSGIARNAGAAAARGTTLLFIDDDIEPFPGMLVEHTSRHAVAQQLNQQLVLVGAPVPVRGAGASFEHVAAWGWWEQQFERMSERGHRFTHDEIFTGVLSVSTAVFRDIGGFDVALTHCHEDLELGLRLLRANVRVGFTRVGGGIHHDVRGIRRLLPRKVAEGRADVLLLQRWPELVRVSPLTQCALPDQPAHRLLRDSAFMMASGVDALLESVALPLLRLFEQLKWRGAWRALQGAVLFHSYWRGAAVQVGSRHTLCTLLNECEVAADAWVDGTTHLVLDLADGIEAAEKLLDERRPDAITVTIRDLHVGSSIAPVNAERLHGGHVRRMLATSLAHELRFALSMCELHATDVATLPAAAPRRSLAAALAITSSRANDDSPAQAPAEERLRTVRATRHEHDG